MFKSSCFDSQINFRSFTNLENNEKSDHSAIYRVNETLSEETPKNNALNEIRKKDPNCIIIAHLNNNSIRNKFEMLQKLIGNNIDILLISATMLDNTFCLSQLTLKGFTPS